MMQNALFLAPAGIAFGAGILVVVLGLAISWRAFQGYRRNQSRPMLLLAIGMFLITVLPTLSELIVVPWFVARYFAPDTGATSLMLTISRVCEAIGIGVIIYSLHSRRGD